MPPRLRDVARVLREEGIEVEKPSSGSHWKARKDGRVYPLPAHRGPKSELDDVYILGLCRAFGLDPEAFRRKL